MSSSVDKRFDRYVYLNCFGSIQQNDFQKFPTGEGSPISISTKLDDEGVVIDVWYKDKCVASAGKTYAEMGVEVKEIENE